MDVQGYLVWSFHLDFGRATLHVRWVQLLFSRQQQQRHWARSFRWNLNCAYFSKKFNYEIDSFLNEINFITYIRHSAFLLCYYSRKKRRMFQSYISKTCLFFVFSITKKTHSFFCFSLPTILPLIQDFLFEKSSKMLSSTETQNHNTRNMACIHRTSSKMLHLRHWNCWICLCFSCV